MAERWFYQHDNQIRGPVTGAELLQLAAAGNLGPNDSVWAEGAAVTSAVPARVLLPSPWSAPKSKPDWLEDVRNLEEASQSAFLPVFDAEPGPPPVPKPAAAPSAPAPSPAPAPPTIEMVPVPPTKRTVPVVEALPPTPTPAPRTDPKPKPTTGITLSPATKPASSTSKVVLTPAATGPCRLTLGAATSPGKVRDRNEDSFLVLQSTWSNLDKRQEMAAIVVADGMGGHQAGDRASRLAITAMSRVLAPILAQAVEGTLTQPKAAVLPDALDRAFQEAHRVVSEAARADATCKDMGSTGVALLVWDGEAYISLVGDCRVYHQRAGRLAQITRDQTLVARMVELGQLTPAEAVNHPRRNEITQAIGLRGGVKPVRYGLKLNPGDYLIAACDGLYAHVEDPTIQAAIDRATSPAQLAQQLVALADQGGGSDNCTVVALCWA